jgi:hypothetical protein
MHVVYSSLVHPLHYSLFYPIPSFKWLWQVLIIHIDKCIKSTWTIFTLLYSLHLSSPSYYFPPLIMSYCPFLSFILLFVLFYFLLAYIHCVREIHCANFQKSYITHWLVGPHHPPSTLNAPLKAIAKGFIILFHVFIWSPPIILPHLYLLYLPSPSHKYPPTLYNIY